MENEQGWIELSHSKSRGLMAWIRCPSCQGIVHLEDVDFPARVSPSPSGDEMRIWLWCEQGHRFAIELQDHSGTMSLAVVPVRSSRPGRGQQGPPEIDGRR